MNKQRSVMVVLTAAWSIYCLAQGPNQNLSREQIRALAVQMSVEENRIIQMESTYLGHGGYNEYRGGILTLRDLHGNYVMTYPLWQESSPAYRMLQQHVIKQRVAYEMRMLAEMAINRGGACIDQVTHRAAICRGSGAVELVRTDLAPGSTLRRPSRLYSNMSK